MVPAMVVTSPQYWSHHTSRSSAIGHKSALGQVDRDQRTAGRGHRMRRGRKSLREIIDGVCTLVMKSSCLTCYEIAWKSLYACYEINLTNPATLNGGLLWSPLTAMSHCLAREGFKWMQRWQNNRRQNNRARRGQPNVLFNKLM